MKTLININLVAVGQLKNNTGQIEGVPKNPRTIKNKDFRNLINSILVFPKMLFIRPITYAENYVVLGGNQRKDALVDILDMGIAKINGYLRDSKEYQEKPQEDKEFIHDFWNDFVRNKKVPAQDVSTMSLDEKREFVIKDNVGFGQDDWNVMELHWDAEKLKNWGVMLPKTWKKEKVEPESGKDRAPAQQMTFTLSESQVELIKQKLSSAKKTNAFKEMIFDNTNANANALFFLLKKL